MHLEKTAFLTCGHNSLMRLIKILFIASFCQGYAVYAKAQANIDSLNALLAVSTIPAEQRISALNQLAAHYNSDSTNQALIYANEAYLLALKANNKKLQITSLLNLSEGYLYNDAYDQALQYGYNALDLSKDLGDKPNIAASYTNLGWIFYDTENADFSMQCHRTANDLYQELGDRKKISVSLNAIGLVFQMKNEYDSAKQYFERSLKIAIEEGMKNTTAAAYNNIGICENSLGRYESAVGYLNKAYAIQQNLNIPLSQAETLNQLAYSKIMLKNYAEAAAILKNSRALIERATSNTKKEKLLDNLNISSQLYQALGNYTQAFEDLQAYIKTRNQIISRTKSDAIASLKMKRETQEKELQIRELEAREELRSFQRNALAVLVLLIIVIGFLFYSKLKQKQKKERELEEMKQALIKRELDNVVLEKQSLHNKLEYKNAELKNYALFISQRNELMRGFIENLTELKLDDELKKDSLGKFNKVIQKFEHDLESNKEAQDFNLSVEENHKDFFFNLLQEYPELTENERRLCAQIRLNLSIKDIASLNNISVKSAEMARYRLRKHFNLEHGESLNDFLKKF